MGEFLAGFDALWLITSAALVFLMQLGFCALEAGLVRARNSINVVAKNTADLCIAGVAFCFVGSVLMFSDGAIADRAIAASPDPDGSGAYGASLLLFQIMFCGTATTIVSGAVAERMRFGVYTGVVLLVALAVYPIAGGWAWRGIDGGAPGWLEAMGFHDFAGSTIVHSIGGWVALAMLLLIGPREGRFGPESRKPEASSMPLAALGTMLMWVGWFGFNGGSALGFTTAVPAILINTFIAGAGGSLAMILLDRMRRRMVRVDAMLLGVLGGLVAVTAGADVYSEGAALLVGVLGGFSVAAGSVLLERLRIDDAVAAVPVHLCAGIVGTLIVPVFAVDDSFPRNVAEQLGIQALGVAAIGAAVFSTCFAVFWAVGRFVSLRVDGAQERLGLNVVEHDARTPIQDLVADMEGHRATGDLTTPVRVEAGSEVEPIAVQYNQVAARLLEDSQRLRRAFEETNRAKADAEAANRSKSAFLANMSHELRTPLNAIIGFSEMMTAESFGPLGGEGRYKEYAGTIREAGEHLLSLVNDILEHARIEAGRVLLREARIDLSAMIASVVRMTEDTAARGGVSIQVAPTPGLPPLIADERILRQVLLNLVSNAVKFTPEGGHVRVTARIGPEMGITVAVTDTGIGMTSEEIGQALEPFTQIDSGYAKAHAGTGLGLPLARAMMRLHGGNLTIASAKGQGTEAILTFPESRTAS